MQSIITNGSVFEFRGLVLHGDLLSWNHKIGIRLASHEYLKRDGGEQEPMGAAAGHFSYRCVLLGSDATAQYNNLVLKIRQNPRGLLIDPRLGRINAACEGLDASEDPGQAVDRISFEIRFIEDALDTAIASEQPLGPPQHAAQVKVSTASLKASVDARFLGNPATSFKAVLAYLDTLTTSATTYVAAALASLATSSPSFELLQLLGAVRVQRDLFLAALDSTLSYTLEPPVSLTPHRAEALAAYAACVQLQESITSLKPPVILFPVGSAMSVAHISTVLYGKDARGKVSEILSLNRIKTPHWVAAGTILKVVAPSVRQ